MSGVCPWAGVKFVFSATVSPTRPPQERNLLSDIIVLFNYRPSALSCRFSVWPRQRFHIRWPHCTLAPIPRPSPPSPYPIGTLLTSAPIGLKAVSIAFGIHCHGDNAPRSSGSSVNNAWLSVLMWKAMQHLIYLYLLFSSIHITFCFQWSKCNHNVSSPVCVCVRACACVCVCVCVLRSFPGSVTLNFITLLFLLIPACL